MGSLKIIFISFILFTSQIIPQTNTFEELYGESDISELGQSIVQKTTGDFVIAGVKGDLFLKCVNSVGEEIWEKTFYVGRLNYDQVKPVKIIETNLEEFVVAGNVQDSIFVLKTDVNGNQLWINKFFRGMDSYFSQLINGYDDSFLLLSADRDQITLRKFNQNGNVLWTKIYDAPVSGFFGGSGMTNLSLGGYIIAGSSSYYRIDNSGEIIWTKEYSNSPIQSIIENSNNELLFGTRNSVFKTDLNGNILWDTPISGSSNDCIVEINNSYFILSKINQGTTIIRKINNSGEEIWDKSYNGRAYQINSTIDNYLIICGEYLYEYKPYLFLKNVWLLKTNTDGEYTDVASISPRKNSVITANKTFKIAWLSTNINEIDIEYSTDNGLNWLTIAENVPADSGYYNWIVPTTFSTNCKLKLESAGNNISEITDGNFSVYINEFGNDVYDFIDINDVKMWFSNNGDGSFDIYKSGPGFYWPKENDGWEKTAIFEDGFVYGSRINGIIRVNGSTYRHGFQAGVILPDGTPDTVNKPENTVWKIKKDWEQLPEGNEKEYYEFVYNNWPADYGAPFVDENGDGDYTPGIDHPDYMGDMLIYYVSNDLDTSRTIFTYGTYPMGIELQTTVFGFDRDDELKNVVFKKYRMINKGNNILENVYLGCWSDDDVGDASDDYFGTDSLLDLAYTYNGEPMDGDGSGRTYGNLPPAVGHKIVQGPIVESFPTDSAKFNGKWRKGYKNLPATSSMFYNDYSNLFRDPTLGVPEGAIEFYYNLQGKLWNGDPIIDPNTGEITNFCVPGDPYLQTGWYEGEGWSGGGFPPGDRRGLISSGQFNLAPGDTQEIAIAILIARGDNNIHSVHKLKQLAQNVQDFYDTDFTTSVINGNNIPLSYSLSQNYPNPFNPATTIEFSTPVKERVTLKVYDILGREVKTLLNEEKPAGVHKIKFNGNNFASGVYFYKIQAGKFIDTKKFILLK